MYAEKSLVEIRQKIHSKPEISGEENETAAFIKKKLQATEPDRILDGIGGTGLIAFYKGVNQDQGKTLMIRAELDGLPIEEQTGLNYQSRNPGRMHACGHDGHMAILLGLAKRLQQTRPEYGNVLLLFQPSEETGRGAGEMLNDKRFKQLNIDRAIALHNLPGYKENTIYIRKNTFACASVGYKVQFKGKSSHAAYPGEGINPAPVIAGFVKAVNNLHEDYIYNDKITAATVTYLKLGEEAFGISPGNGEGGVTLRAETDELLASMQKELTEQFHKLSKSFDGELLYEKVEPFAAVVNDEAGVNQLKEQLSKDQQFRIEELPDPFPWSEDFGEFRKKCPITLFGLGAGRDSHPMHSEKYDFNDRLLDTGVEAFWKMIEHYTNSMPDE